MLKKLAKYFGTGLAAVLPFALVIWVLVFIFQTVDGLLGPTIDNIPGLHIPGLGFALVVVMITLVGLLARHYIGHQVFSAMERMFTRIPFVKSLYSTFKDIVHNLMGQSRGFQRTVLVEWPDERALVVGFVTHESLPSSLDPDGSKIAVYLSNSFQFAGITILVERNKVHPCSLTVEEAFKFVLSAGLGHGTTNGVMSQNATEPTDKMSSVRFDAREHHEMHI